LDIEIKDLIAQSQNLFNQNTVWQAQLDNTHKNQRKNMDIKKLKNHQLLILLSKIFISLNKLFMSQSPNMI
jgi:hypothetical protein